MSKTQYTVIEARINGKLHDLIFDGPEHAIKRALEEEYLKLKELKVISNPRNYKLDFINKNEEN